MAYFTQNSATEEIGYEYPPVPNSYTNSYTTLDADSGHRARVPSPFVDPGPFCYPSLDYQATATSTASQPYTFYPDHGREILIPRQIAPAPSTSSSIEHGVSTSPTFTCTSLSQPDATDSKLGPLATEAGYQKRTRGTTGTHVCDTCGYKFTQPSSLKRHSGTCSAKQRSGTSYKKRRSRFAISSSSQRHNNTRPGKEQARKSISAQDEVTQSKSTSLVSDHGNHTLPTTEPTSSLSEEQTHNVGLNSNLHAVPAASAVIDPPGTGIASSIRDPNGPNKSGCPQPYVPRGFDTSADHKTFFCDLCPGSFARRDVLQIHKTSVHALTEIPYSLDWDTVKTPPYLAGVTLENANKHLIMALKVFNGGGLSSSPCQSCITKGLECIVNPVASSKCSCCCSLDNGNYCGAAGVKYR